VTQTAAEMSLEVKSTDANVVKLRLNNGNTLHIVRFSITARASPCAAECEFPQMYTVYYPTKGPIRDEAENVRIPTWK